MVRWVVVLLAAIATGKLLADEPSASLFPLQKNLTLKYALTSTTDGVPAAPLYQTITCGSITTVGADQVATLGDEMYAIHDDGVYLVGRRDGQKVQPVDPPQQMLPLRPRTGDTWHITAGQRITTSTCLGTRTIDTKAGKFDAQCILIAMDDGPDSNWQRQTYRFYARGLGLVRETIAEENRNPDGSKSKFEMLRDLVAVDRAHDDRATVAAKPIGAEHLRGLLLDSTGAAVAQTPITLRRLDHPATSSLQTDISGQFAQDHLDPAGTYRLEVRLAGFESAEIPLVSPDGSTIDLKVQLKAERPASTQAIRSDTRQVESQEVPVLSERCESIGSTIASHRLIDMPIYFDVTPATVPADPVDDLLQQGRVLEDRRDHAGAIAKYQEALKARPDEPRAHALMAVSLMNDAKFEPAETQINEAIRLSPQNFTFQMIAGHLQILRDNTAAGQALYAKAAQASPQNAGNVYADLASALGSKNESGKFDDQILAALKSAASASPPSLDALFNLGQTYAGAGRQEGRPYLQKYVEETMKLPESKRDARKLKVAKQLMRALDAIRQ